MVVVVMVVMVVVVVVVIVVVVVVVVSWQRLLIHASYNLQLYIKTIPMNLKAADEG